MNGVFLIVYPEMAVTNVYTTPVGAELTFYWNEYLEMIHAGDLWDERQENGW